MALALRPPADSIFSSQGSGSYRLATRSVPPIWLLIKARITKWWLLCRLWKCEQLVDPTEQGLGYLALQPGLIKNKLANMADNENSWPCLSRRICGGCGCGYGIGQGLEWSGSHFPAGQRPHATQITKLKLKNKNDLLMLRTLFTL